MAGIRATFCTGELALTATVAKTLAQLKAPTNQRLMVDFISVCFDGVTPTNEPVLVQIMRQTTAGTMSAGTPYPNDPTIDESLQSTVQYNATVEPTSGAVLLQFDVHPQAGLVFTIPRDQRIVVQGGGRLGVVCTAPQNVNAIVTLGYEE